MKNSKIKNLTEKELNETYGGASNLQTKWVIVNGKLIRISS